jgi:hypothetical protein
MIEFDAGHEVRVAGYVGDHETGRFRFRKHCELSRSISGRGAMAPAQKSVQLLREKRIREYRRLRSAAENFASEILEEIDLEQLTYGRERALKERVAHWHELLDGAAAT